MTPQSNAPQDFGIRWRPAEFNPDDLAGLLERLRFEMKRVDDPALAPLRPGASEDEIRTRLAPTGLTVHPDLITWYQWTTGPEPGQGFGLGLGSTTPVALESVASLWADQDDDYPSFDYPNYENGRWMPFLETAGFDCAPDEFGGSIVEVWGYAERFWRVPQLSVLVWWWIGLRVDGPRGGGLDATQFASLFGEVQVCRSLSTRRHIDTL